MLRPLEKPFDVLIFDLDDTLYKTTEKLTHPALLSAFNKMIKYGLQADIKTCFAARKKTLKKYNRETFLKYLTKKYKVEGSPEKCLQKGLAAFEKKTLELNLSASVETHALLRTLSTRYSLFLVTAGVRKVQKRKVKMLGIAAYFDHVFYVELHNKERKRDAFLKIMHITKLRPQRLLSIGNRLDIEITDSKELGLKTCHILQGEYRHIRPRSDTQIPDYTVEKISEITNVCRL